MIDIPPICDGVDLTHTVGRAMTGMKVVDPGANHPQTGLPLTQIFGSNSDMYSHPYCVILDKETEPMVILDFKWLFEFFLHAAGKIANNHLLEDQWMNLHLSVIVDMSDHWKGLLTDGTTKVQHLFCGYYLL